MVAVEDMQGSTMYRDSVGTWERRLRSEYRRVNRQSLNEDYKVSVVYEMFAARAAGEV